MTGQQKWEYIVHLLGHQPSLSTLWDTNCLGSCAMADWPFSSAPKKLLNRCPPLGSTAMLVQQAPARGL